MLPRLVVTLAAVTVVAACGGDGGAETASTPVIDPGDAGDYQPDVDPANFVAAIDNPYLPWRAGSRWVYEGESDGEQERNEIVVTDDHKTVMGIEATVVHDAVYAGDQLKEDTYDWYAQ